MIHCCGFIFALIFEELLFIGEFWGIAIPILLGT